MTYDLDQTKDLSTFNRYSLQLVIERALIDIHVLVEWRLLKLGIGEI